MLLSEATWKLLLRGKFASDEIMFKEEALIRKFESMGDVVKVVEGEGKGNVSMEVKDTHTTTRRDDTNN